ncbi:hypothetical protein CcCBS67573_g00321 [Chytriomyces confervae]|uniref:Mini-chromosome maintenance complex-binding protein n=1 Tax=Chytriomyces confervae TaxID=246404 RepID=A0A507FQ73_9FUNG|nr:hypothetical protein CcCBS67573_g00321 [Chytriomyces confervae]
MEHQPSPLERLHELIATSGGDISAAQTTFKDQLLASRRLNDIPSLSASSTPGTLVRFRAMVQDNGFSPQIYMSHLNLVNEESGEKMRISCHFSDEISPLKPADSKWSVNESENDFMFGSYSQKWPMCCVAVPGQTAWARALVDNVPESENVAMELGGVSLTGQTNVHVGRKYSTDPYSKPVMVKFYGEEPNDLQLSTVADFIGILELGEPLPTATDAMENDVQMQSFLNDELDPFRGLPVLHCVFHSRVSPLEHPFGGNQELSADVDAKILRENALEFLKPFVLDDRLAAEYLLVHLVSKIRARHESFQTGNFPLNLYNFPTPASSKSVFDAVSLLLPLARRIPLSIHYLNTNRMAPGVFVSRESWKEMNTVKDKETRDSDLVVHGLVSGELQLADRTYVVVDEVGMDAGVLKEQGVINVRQMSDILKFAELPFAVGSGADSPDHTVSKIPVDLSFLVLSQGKCMFDVDCMMPIMPNGMGAPSSVVNNDELRDMNPLRLFLLGVTKTEEYSISEEMNTVLTNHFTEARKKTADAGQPLYSQESFMLRMEIARNWSLLSGESSLSMDAWKKSGEMEAERIERCERFASLKRQNSDGGIDR